MQVNVYTVSQINGYIKRLFENDVFLSELYIEGEISNFKMHTSGHLYFSLKDETGSMDCVMFRSYAQNLDFLPQNGEGILVKGRVSLYEKTGKYQLYVSYMQPAGKGALYMAFEKLKNKLAAEGLFDAAYKKNIPQYPKTVALVTSPTGAAVRDMINVSRRRNPSVKLVIVPVLVQGENAAADIARGIKSVNDWGGADVIIVGRGGGSMEDLWAFNEEITARAIFASDIPVISAVGHEVDFTIADLVADMRAPTPSAAAELAVPASEPMDRQNRNALKRIDTAMKSRLLNGKMRLSHALGVRGMRRPLENIFNLQITVEDCLSQAGKAMVARLEKNNARFAKSFASIENLSPMNVIKRGFSVVYDSNDTLVRSITQLKTDDVINVSVSDGTVTAVVEKCTGK